MKGRFMHAAGALAGLALLAAGLVGWTRTTSAADDTLVVVVSGVEGYALGDSSLSKYFREARNVTNAIKDLEKKGYTPTQFLGVGQDSVLIFAEKR